jgi:DMSO/TMAO reductase YedYZ molybdopterin-dependent catalytic subunit
MNRKIHEAYQNRFDRRMFLACAGAASLPFFQSRNSFGSAANESPTSGNSLGALPGMIMRERSPVNLEFPFPTLNDTLVPNHRFFVRSHFAVPKIELESWRLKVDGHVKNELQLNYQELRQLPTSTVSATIECAGNSRAFLVPKARGVLWELGAVGNAKWSGVSLSNVLERAGVREGAVEVILEGADVGEVSDDPKSPGPIHFVRSLPIAKAKKPEVLLALQMNNETLPLDHGFPLRAIVPGWYGMASVKWLTRITVSAVPFQGYWQTMSYTYWKREADRPTLIPISEMQVKAEVARPCLHEVIKADSQYRIFGAAWAGEANVKQVDVSTDGGMTWHESKLLGDATPFTWRLWEFEWRVPKAAGAYRVMAKATDDRGRSQTAEHNRDHGGYLIHHTLPIDVEVR